MWEIDRHEEVWGGCKPDSPTPLSSTVGLSIQRCACSIFPSKWTAAFAGLLLATALLVLDCRFCRAVAICLAKALASGVSPLPLEGIKNSNLIYHKVMAGMRSVLLLNLEFTYKYGQMRTFYLKKNRRCSPSSICTMLHMNSSKLSNYSMKLVADNRDCTHFSFFPAYIKRNTNIVSSQRKVNSRDLMMMTVANDLRGEKSIWTTVVKCERTPVGLGRHRAINLTLHVWKNKPA